MGYERQRRRNIIGVINKTLLDPPHPLFDRGRGGQFVTVGIAGCQLGRPKKASKRGYRVLCVSLKCYIRLDVAQAVTLGTPPPAPYPPWIPHGCACTHTHTQPLGFQRCLRVIGSDFWGRIGVFTYSPHLHPIGRMNVAGV